MGKHLTYRKLSVIINIDKQQEVLKMAKNKNVSKQSQGTKVTYAQKTGERGSWGSISPVTQVIPSRKNKPKRDKSKLNKELSRYF